MTSRPPRATPGARSLPLASAAVTIAGCFLMLTAVLGPGFRNEVPFTDRVGYVGYDQSLRLGDWLLLASPAVATVVGLWLARWWPCLLAAAAVLLVPSVLGGWYQNMLGTPVPALQLAAYYLALIALLAYAQGSGRATAARGAVIVALAVGPRMMGLAFMNIPACLSWETLRDWRAAMLVVAIAALIPLLRKRRRGDAVPDMPERNGSACWSRERWPRRCRSRWRCSTRRAWRICSAWRRTRSRGTVMRRRPCSASSAC